MVSYMSTTRFLAWRWLAVVTVAFCLPVTMARASITANVTYTGDNRVLAMYLQEAADTPQAIDISGQVNNDDWTLASSVSLSGLNPGTSYTLYFQVRNNRWFGQSGNPAGFLAEISGDVQGKLLTSTDWQWTADPLWGLPFSPPTTAWENAVEWGYLASDPTNPDAGSSLNGGNNIWGNILGGPIADISTDARWIWSDHNGIELVCKNKGENFIWLRTTINTTAPEPASAIVWCCLPLVMLAGGMTRRLRRRRR